MDKEADDRRYRNKFAARRYRARKKGLTAKVQKEADKWRQKFEQLLETHHRVTAELQAEIDGLRVALNEKFIDERVQ